MITLQTNHGNICLELDFENTPNTVANFLSYAQSGFYEGTIFHRVIKGFMIQGGGFDADMEQKTTGASIENEAATCQPNKRYTIAMARTSDPHSATAQFFINVADNNFLNFSKPSAEGWGYCVFGKVIQGSDIVDKIATVAVKRHGHHDDVPVEHVIIEKVLISEDEKNTA